MRKLFKCRRALSPVVAAIILIAVTVAVSIAVAAWMGALTFTFMKTEELKITSMTFGPTTGSSGVANNTVVLSIRNSGTSKVTVSEVKVNDASITSWSGSAVRTAAYDAGATTPQITIYMGSTPWVTGNKYKVSLLSATGTTVAAYETTA
jgi:flagellin-like protein